MALPPGARAACLDAGCGADPVLRAEVDAQLKGCARALGARFLAQVAAARAAPLLAGLPDAARTADGKPPSHGPDSPGRDVEGALRTALAGLYDVERELRRGGTATVYLARDTRHDRHVALKVLDPALGAAMSTGRFLREIRVTARLTHPHILPLHDSGEVGGLGDGTGRGLLYYVMPYVEGETLRECLARRGPLPIDESLRLLREVAGALDHAHRHGVVHRDIKPANILLADGHAVVADFGIARAMDRALEPQETAQTSLPTSRDAGDGDVTLTAGGMSPGTPAYMAPEQIRGGAVDHRADLYALGVVAHEVLTGAHPFDTRSRRALVAAHLMEAPPPLAASRPDVPPALAALVTRLLAKDPARRPQSAAEVLTAVSGVESGARPAPAAPAPARPRPRRPAMAAITLLALAGALTLGARHMRRTPSVGQRSASEPVVPAASTTRGIASLAVLPFVNTGGDPIDDYFSDGLTDELSHALNELPGIRLAGRTSSYSFRGKNVAAPEIGRALDVAALVTGTVRRDGDRLRVTAQLVGTLDGKVLWDSLFESHSGNVFAVQDQLTGAMVAALSPTLAGSWRGTQAGGGRGTSDAEAYDLYLKGRYYWLERGAANVERSIGYFRRAIDRDPSFARAYAGLAMAYEVLPAYAASPAESVLVPFESRAAHRAVALDSMLADAQVALGLALEHELRYREAESHYRAALALEPSNAFARHALGALLLNLGRTDEAVTELQRSALQDPMAKSAVTANAEALIFARRPAEAAAASRRALALEPDFPLAISTLGLAQALGGRADSAVRTLERGMRLHPEVRGQRSYLLFAYAAAGRWADATRLRAPLDRPGGDPSGGVEAAFAALVFGDREPLLRLLSTPDGPDQWVATFFGLGCHPLLDPLRADPRFREAMQRLTVEPCPYDQPWPIPPR